MATFSTVAALTITTASAPDSDGQLSAGVDNSTDEFQRIHWYSRMKSGSVAPTVDSIIEFYFFREDDHSPEYVTDGETLTDSDLTATPENAHQIGAIVVTADTLKEFFGEGVVEDPGPGQWAIGFMNETGQTLTSTEAGGFVHWVGEKA